MVSTTKIQQAKFIPLCNKYFPGFSILNIGFSVTYCRQFLSVPNSSFSMLQPSAVSPFGRRFVRELQTRQRQVYTWTVNDEKNMDWCIRRGVDGVITDNIPKFLEVCKGFDLEKKPGWSLKMVLGFAYFNFWIFLFSAVFMRRYGTCIDGKTVIDKSK